MRLMLGDKSGPSLLVSVNDNYDPKKFEFTVINGGWDGVFTNGHITIIGDPSGDWSDLGPSEILTDNQDRLRCNFGDYNTVFANFHNPDYVAPQYKEVQRPICWDDDIPF